ncbi:MAG: PCRF domain-containing protein [Candidatus Pacebacteria bacterium]|nr:PCRF domain-containing protein [Candidatus Paceibacterota bacterium]
MSFNPYQDQIDQLQSQIEENEALLSDPELGELAKLEIEKLTKQKETLESAASDLEAAQSDEPKIGEEAKNCIIEIRGGAGGDEAKLWAEDLKRMYLRFCEILGLKVEYIDDLVFKVKGNTKSDNVQFNELCPTAYSTFKYESGVHRVQRVPSTESAGRIHTSTASVAVLPEVHASAVEIRDEDLEWQFIRAGGAGGQSVNKTSSAVRLTHTPSGIQVSARQERKQAQNRQIALEMLRSQLWEIQEEERMKEIGDARSAIGRNMRSEKIRTYNYPQSRVTDHRIKESWHNLPTILEGDLYKVISKTKEMIEDDNEVSQG